MAMNFSVLWRQKPGNGWPNWGFGLWKKLVGRIDLLELIEGHTSKQKNLDLSPILSDGGVSEDKPHTCQVKRNAPFDRGELAERMVADTLSAIENKSGGTFQYEVTNCDRSIGARLSGEIAKRYGNQRYGRCAHYLQTVWNCRPKLWGLECRRVEPDFGRGCNDYVGKGMTGGKLVVFPPQCSSFKTQDTAIIGNTCLYGATGGKLYAAGRAGERFGVRNSGAFAVVEGAGDHCCEYMTGGIVTVLGGTGYNFGAGMTGGFAYVLDLNNSFVDKYNHELVEIQRISSESMEAYRNYLRSVVQGHVDETQSEWGQHILDNFDDYTGRFWLVKLKAASLKTLLDSTKARPE